jgi:hypothetical protein
MRMSRFERSAGAVESLQAVLELVPHAMNLLDGKTEHS